MDLGAWENGGSIHSEADDDLCIYRCESTINPKALAGQATADQGGILSRTEETPPA